MKTSILFYCAIALVAAGSVLFGLDWQSAPMSPMPPIKVVAYTAPVRPPPPPAAAARAPSPAAPSPAEVSPAKPETARPVQPAIANAPLRPDAGGVPKIAGAEPAKPLCDVAACAQAYRSFRESDCTYNPSFGPRRLCTKGVPPNAPKAAGDAAPGSNAAADANAPANAKCNVNACAAAYGSFTASDCSYQPYDGPRRLCEK